MEDLDKLLREFEEKGLQRELESPFTYVQQLPGKNIRQKMIVAFNHWMDIPRNKLDEIVEIVQMLHSASLLIDDIEDNSCLRRGYPVAHAVYGVPLTLNAANQAYFLALQKVQRLGHSSAVTIYTEQMLELHRGQGMEIYWREKFICPSESEYKFMVIGKTVGLFMLAIRLMQLFSKSDNDYSKLVTILGLYFQIRDDYCNLTSTEYADLKSFCEDLTEGKFSFPILYAINNKKNDQEISAILKQRTENVEVKRRCVELLEEAGSFEYTRNSLNKLHEEARMEIEQLGPNEYMEAFLKELGKL